MQWNQRARLVLNRFGLILVLLVIGLVTGIGIVRYRSHETAREATREASVAHSVSGIVLSSNRLDFGTMGLDHAVERALLLRNTSTDRVTVRFEGSDGFVVSPDSLTIEPSGTARVTVTANPRRPGAFKDELRVIAGEGSDSAFVVVLEGRARNADGSIARDVDGEEGSSSDGATTIAELSETGADPSAPSVDGQAVPPGSVKITRSSGNDSDGPAGDADAGASGKTPGMVVVPYDPSRTRSMAETPIVRGANAGPLDGEEPTPVGQESKRPSDLDRKKDPTRPTPSVPILVVSPASSLTAMGSKNQFYPQQIGIIGSGGGGPFQLASMFQLPRLSIAFGQSLLFNQTGGATGSFDASSGQVSLQVPMEAVDPNGNSAPFVMNLTTGAVVARNTNGVLFQMTGQARTPDSVVRLVGIGQIPTGYANSAEQQFVLLDIWGSLSFSSSVSGDSGGGE